MKFLAVVKTILYFCTIIRPVVDACKGVVHGVEGLQKDYKDKTLTFRSDVYNNDKERFQEDNMPVPSFVVIENEKEVNR